MKPIVKKKAPAAHLPRAWSRDDVKAYIAGEVSRAMADSMNEAEDSFREQRGLRSSAPMEVSHAEIFRAGSAPGTLVDDRGHIRVSRGDDRGMLSASYVGWIVRAGGDKRTAYEMAKSARVDRTSPYGTRVLRALGESTIAGGGAFVPENIASDFIELLYATTVYLNAQPTEIPVSNGNLTLPKLATGATATWVGESQNVQRSEQTGAQVRLDLKKLAVLTPMSNELLEDSSPAVDAMVRDDLVNNASVVVDAALLRGTGSAFSPRGLKSYADTYGTNQFNSAGVTVAQVTGDLTDAAQLLEDGEIKFVRPHWFFAPRSRWFLMSLRDGNNNLVFAPEMATGKLMGFPFGVTTNIPVNLGGGTNESEVYLVDMVHMAVGNDPRGMQLDMRDGVAYFDGSNVQAAFSRDESVVRMKLRIDNQARQGGKEIAMIQAVTWGA